MRTKQKHKEAPIYEEICREYRAAKKMPHFVTIAPMCTHPRIEQDEPRDGGGAWYRCKNPKCWQVIDPDEWEWEHNKAWDWWDK